MKKAIILGFGALVVVLTALSAWIHFSEPELSGKVKVTGLSAPVNVVRDEFSVPHIYAASENDAYRALGYVQAQDRLFQLDLMRHVASGRLAEWFGPKLVARDKKLRTLGIAHHAEAWLQTHKLAPRLKSALDAYLEGINAYAQNGRRPLEHRLLGLRAEPFREADALSMIGLMAFGFAEAMATDPLYADLQNVLGDEKLRALWPDYTPGAALALSDSETAALFDFRDDILAALPAPLHGSNAWVISPTRSKSGQALLANDPHIGFANPSVWYEAHLSAPGLDTYGHFLSLVPFAVLGQTRALGWGLTMYENDDMDFYAETLRDDEVLFEGQYEPVHHRDEVIVVRGQDAVHFTVRETRHGPILSDAFEQLADAKQPVSLRWGFYLPDNDPLAALYGINQATNVEEFQNALKTMLAPGLAIVYADAKGHIGLFDIGVLPIRQDGRGIRNGQSGDDEWNAFVPPEEWPKSIDPKSGFLVTANNRPELSPLHTEEGDYALQGYWQPPYRATHITELLRSQPKWSRDDLRAVQTDATITSAKHFLAVLLPLVADAPNKDIATLLGKWNGQGDIDAKEPLVYATWRHWLLHELYADELGEKRFEQFEHLAVAQHSLERALSDPAFPFWDDVRTKQIETPEVIAKRALTLALDDLQKRLGDQKHWRWGALHTIEFKHPFGVDKGFAAGIFNLGPYPATSGNEAINNMNARYANDFQVSAGPSTRRLLDFADLAHPLSVLPTGESGNRLSTHYGDQTHLFLGGGYRHVTLERNEVEEHRNDVLELVPKDTSR